MAKEEQIMRLCDELVLMLNERLPEQRIFAFKQTYDYLVRKFSGSNLNLPDMDEFIKNVKIG